MSEQERKECGSCGYPAGRHSFICAERANPTTPGPTPEVDLTDEGCDAKGRSIQNPGPTSAQIVAAFTALQALAEKHGPPVRQIV